MNDPADLLATLQFCEDALSPLSNPAHKQRLNGLRTLLQPEAASEYDKEARAIPLDRYLFTLEVCHNLTGEEQKHRTNIATLTQFVREELSD